MSRPRAETMAAVTVPPRPNGLPTASTQSPTRGGLVRELDIGEVAPALDFDQCDIGTRVGANHFGAVSLSVIGPDLDGLGIFHDVIVSHRIAVGGNEEP